MVIFGANVIMLFFFFIIRFPAWAVLIWWFAVQVITGLPELSPMRPEVSGGVAVWAHVGGFVTGMLLIKFFESEPRVLERTAIRHAQHPGEPW